MDETEQGSTPEADQPPVTEEGKEAGILRSIGNRALAVIDAPFEHMARGMVGTLYGKGLNPKEHTVVEQAITAKYTPALRNSALLAIAASPGVLINDPSSVLTALAVVSSVTGIAWFAMSLKEVKEKFIDFGVELTGDMLKAFLTTTLIIGITSAHGIASNEINAVLRWAQEAGINPSELFNSRLFKLAATSTTILVGVKIFQWLIKAVIKFDVNDSMLTGSADLAKKFYERSLSSLRDAAKVLKAEHSLQAANYQIGVALNHYFEFLIKINATLPEGLNEESISQITKSSTKAQKEFDSMVLPTLKSMLEQYEGYIGEDQALRHRYQFTLDSIEELERLYTSDQQPAQSLADSSISTVLENISEFLEMFQDELVQTNA